MVYQVVLEETPLNSPVVIRDLVSFLISFSNKFYLELREREREKVYQIIKTEKQKLETD